MKSDQLNIQLPTLVQTWVILSSLFLATTNTAVAATAEEINRLIQEEKFQSALDAVDETIEKVGRQNRLMQVKGFLHLRLSQLEEAEEIFSKLIERTPDDPEVINNLGVVYQLQKKYPEAAEKFKRTIEDFPDFAPAYENLGDTYTHMARQTYILGSEKVSDSRILIAKSEISNEFHTMAKDRAKLLPPDTSAEESTIVSEEEVAAAATNQAEDMEQGLISFLESWIQGWSSLNTDAYFSHYSRDFAPTNKSLSDWIEHKINVIGRAKFINISLEDVAVEQTSNESVKVSFQQFYESDTYTGSSYKELELILFEGEWYILTET